jgi:hypothetical protein
MSGSFGFGAHGRIIGLRPICAPSALVEHGFDVGGSNFWFLPGMKKPERCRALSALARMEGLSACGRSARLRRLSNTDLMSEVRIFGLCQS